MAEQESIPVTKGGKQTATIVPKKQGGLVVKDKGGQGKDGVIGTFKKWGDVLGDPVIATAILGRLLHYSHVLNIRGESCRLREKRSLPESSPAARPRTPTPRPPPVRHEPTGGGSIRDRPRVGHFKAGFDSNREPA